MRRLKLLIVLIAALEARAQTSSQPEQQYLFSVLPLIDRGDFARAEVELVRGVEQFPRSAILHNALGIVYRKENKIDLAVAAFRKAIDILPSFTAAQLQLASLDQQQGNKAEAAKLYRGAAESTENFEALVAAGLGLADCEDYAGAVRVLSKAHAQRPDSSSVTYNLALAQFKAGDSPTALASLRDAGSADPDVVYLRGKIMESLGDGSAAQQIVSACHLEPANETFCAEAAAGAMRQDKFVEALRLLQPALEKSPRSVALLSSAALAQFRLGRYGDALQSYRSALEQAPNQDAPREGLGFLYYMTGDLQAARSVVEEGLKNSNADFYLAYLDALILFRLSSQTRPQAAASVERAIRTNPRFAPAYFLRGKILMDQNNAAAALADFERAVEVDPKYPLPYYKMAQIYSRQGRTREAEDARKKFSDLGSLREEEMLARQAQDILMPARH
ncbi:MAG: tetratricopeptide repeat protein [Acidobacteriia bacterium]|nr:tetratricopeptide repeat protein [Terriglobia bacterium]